MNKLALGFLLLTFQTAALADSLQDMETALTAGDTKSAKSIVNGMYRDRSIVRGPGAAYLSGYDTIVDIFSRINSFIEKSEKFELSKTISDYTSANYAHESMVSLTKNAKPFAVSSELIDTLNKKLSDADEKMRTIRRIQNDMEIAQAEENRKLEEQREREFQARQAARSSEQQQHKREMELQKLAEEKNQERLYAKMVLRKKVCGSDFGTPHIGMTLERAQQCVGNFKLNGQINRVDGIISTYWAGNLYANVINGKIVAWGRL